MEDRALFLRIRHVNPGITNNDILGVTMSFGKITGLRVKDRVAVVRFDTDAAATDAENILAEHSMLLRARLGAQATVDTVYHTRSKTRNKA